MLQRKKQKFAQDLETFSEFGAFFFQIMRSSSCRARRGKGIMDDGREDGGWKEKRRAGER